MINSQDIGLSNFSSSYENAEKKGNLYYSCTICGFKTIEPEHQDLGTARGNTARFIKTFFHLWKCPKCNTIYSIDPVDFHDIYADYPLNNRRLDFFAKITMRNLLKRLERAGIRKTDSILDYGCGNGLFVHFLKEQGYNDVAGYDPYVQKFSNLPEQKLFDCVLSNDVIEHVPNPRIVLEGAVNRLKPGGLLYVGTADSEGVNMNDLEPHIMRLHQPFHRIIITKDTLVYLGIEIGLKLVRVYRRSYMDTLIPFANYRFLDEFSNALGHNMDMALDPSSGKILLRRLTLWFYAFLGYFFPSAYEPAAVFRKPMKSGASL